MTRKGKTKTTALDPADGWSKQRECSAPRHKKNDPIDQDHSAKHQGPGPGGGKTTIPTGIGRKRTSEEVYLKSSKQPMERLTGEGGWRKNRGGMDSGEERGGITPPRNSGHLSQTGKRAGTIKGAVRRGVKRPSWSAGQSRWEYDNSHRHKGGKTPGGGGKASSPIEGMYFGGNGGHRGMKVAMRTAE